MLNVFLRISLPTRRSRQHRHAKPKLTHYSLRFVPTPKKKKLLILLKVGIGIGLLVLLIGKIDFEQFKERMKQVPLQSYLLGVAIYMGGMAIRTLRWKLLLGAVEEKLPLSMLIRFQFIGTFFNQFLPTSVGGDGVRVYFLCREKVSWEKAVGSVLVERIVGMLILVLLGLIAAVAGYRLYQNNWIYLILAALLIIMVSGTLVLFSGRVARLIVRVINKLGFTRLSNVFNRFSEGLRIYRSHPPALIGVTLLSFAYQLVVIWLFYYFSRQLGMTLSIWYFLLFIPIVMSVSQVPISPNGTGVREWACTLLFTSVGADEAQSVALAICYWLLQLGPGILGGALFGLTSSMKILDDMKEMEEGVIGNE
jgi:hypothetical protein